MQFSEGQSLHSSAIQNARTGLDRSVVALTLGFGGCLLANLAGLPLAGAMATSAGCLALLVFGLPHGALDLELIQNQSRGPWTSLVRLLGLYLGCAGVMAGFWWAAPVLALTAFIAIAVVHFAEDWQGTGARVLSHGLALAVLAAPSLLHRSELDLLFVALTDQPGATVVTDGLTLVAPVAGVLGLVGVISLWSAGRKAQAIAATVVLSGMVLLPPLVGFGLYFCLFHSPRHLGEGLRTVRLPQGRALVAIVMPITLAAGVIAAAIYRLEFRLDLPSRMVASSFMTLSILTVPHMLVPGIVQRLAMARKASGTQALFSFRPATFTPD